MLKRIRIVNFKSLADVTVGLGPVTVLVGRSGTGKTNFVQAIRFLRDYISSRQRAFAGQRWDAAYCATASLPSNSAASYVSFEVVFEVPAHDGEFTYALSLRPVRAGQVISESLSLNGEDVYRAHQGKWVREPRIHPQIAPLHTLAIDRINGIEQVTLAYFALTGGIGCYDFSSDVLTSGKRGKTPVEGLSDDATNYIDIFNGLVRDARGLASKKEIVAALQILNTSVATVDMDMPARQKLLVAHTVGDRVLNLELAQQSEGFRRFLAHLLAIYQSPPKQTLRGEN